MQKQLDRIEEKVDQVKADVAEQKVIAAKQQISLDEHIRRTELLETRADKNETRTASLEKKANMADGVFKFIGIIGVLAGVVKAVVTVLDYLK